MGQKSTIQTLPEDVKKLLDRKIGENKMTLDDLDGWLDDQGHPRSRSAIHRHSQKIQDVAKKMRESREITEALVAEIGPDATEGKTGRLLIEILQKLTFDVLITKAEGDDESTPMELMRLAKAIKEMASAQKTDTDREAKLREMVVKKTKDAAAQAVEGVAKEAGLSQDTVESIKARILGVDVP